MSLFDFFLLILASSFLIIGVRFLFHAFENYKMSSLEKLNGNPCYRLTLALSAMCLILVIIAISWSIFIFYTVANGVLK